MQKTVLISDDHMQYREYFHLSPILKAKEHEAENIRVGNKYVKVIKSAFTLAEVLITLGIIGVVAALTIPNLMGEYRKRIVETRLAKFYTTINQAITMSELDNGPREYWDEQPTGLETDENDEIHSKVLPWFNTYIKPYLLALDAKANINWSSGRIFTYFADGSLVIIGNESWLFIPEAKNMKDKDYPETSDSGVKWFTFYFAPYNDSNQYYYRKGVEPYKGSWDGTRDMLLNNSKWGCKENTTKERAYCAALIQMNGWKIPDDYPFKF